MWQTATVWYKRFTDDNEGVELERDNELERPSGNDTRTNKSSFQTTKKKFGLLLLFLLVLMILGGITAFVIRYSNSKGNKLSNVGLKAISFCT